MKKVHIIYPKNPNDIVSRMMSSLADGSGWTMSETVRPSADINYFGLYLDAKRHPEIRGKVATWFSHYEVETPEKTRVWNDVAEWVDIRLTSAPQYFDQLNRYGETYLVIPPIDPQFTPKFRQDKPETLRSIPTIGLSGFVYPNGRKGESLAEKLAKYCESKAWHLSASGKGWKGIRDIQHYDWAQMPDFFRSLDVLVVTSETEGIPMPPLEALACGIPVVVPRGVGLLDDINSQYVFRYEAGDFEQMLEAINDALYPERAVTHFSNQNWVNSHKKAFGII